MKLLSLWLVVLLLTACQPIQAAPPHAGAVHPTPPAVTITASAQGVTMPTALPAGVVSVTFQNHTTAPAHEGECGGVVDLIRLAEGKTAADFMRVLEAGGFDPAVATALGGGCARAGQSTHALYNLEPGAYAALVMAGEGPPQLAEFVVKAGANQATAPQAAVTMQLVDFSFVLPDQIKAGPQLWSISNQGTQWHHMSIVRLNKGVTIDQVLAMVMAEEEPAGPPPAQEMALWEVMSPGVTAWATIDLPPGEYYVLCFLPDLSANPPMVHAGKGMVRLLKVTE